MKLRIRGNSVRLRLTQSEVREIDKEASVQDQLSFPDGGHMIYRLELGDNFDLSREGDTLAITIPRAIGKHWVGSDEVGVEHDLSLEKGSLRILVEKDFKCLTDRIHEDESDMYDNPDTALC